MRQSTCKNEIFNESSKKKIENSNWLYTPVIIQPPPSSTQTIDTKNTLIADQNYKLRVNGNLILSKEKHYYFSDSDFNILPVNNKNLMKVFAKQKGKIENYIKSNNTDLNNENNLKNFFTYLKSVF